MPWCPSRKPKSGVMLDMTGSCTHSCPTLLCCSWYLISMRALTMPPVLSALLAFVVTFFQARHAMPLKILALQHPGAVSRQTVGRPRLRPSDRVC